MIEYWIVAVGFTLSIQVTVAIALPVLPARSRKVNSKLQFQVNVWLAKFNQVIASLNQVTVAIIFWLVNQVIEYSTVAVGLGLSFHNAKYVKCVVVNVAI